MPADSLSPKVRATGLLVHHDCLLLVKQVLTERTHWNLPGGGVESFERVDQALVREMYEECGLHIEVGDLLYVCDRFKGLGRHVIDMSFEVHLAPGERCALAGYKPVRTFRARVGDERLADVRMVPIADLGAYGFSQKFVDLVAQGFPGRGSYCGDFHAFYNAENAASIGGPAILRDAMRVWAA